MRILRIEHLNGSELQCENGDVVLLAVGLSGAGDFFGGLRADRPSAFESEEFAGGGLRFDDAIGEEGEAVVRGNLKCGVGIGDIGGTAKGQAGFEGDFFSVAVGARWPALAITSAPSAVMRAAKQVTKPPSVEDAIWEFSRKSI